MTSPSTSGARPVPTDRPVRVAILDDYMEVALNLADWSALDGRAEITVFNTPFPDIDAAAEALRPFDVISIMRERQPVPRALIEALPELRLIAMTGARNPTLDVAAAREHGVQVVSTGSSSSGAFATVELAWGLILSLMRHIPDQVQGMRSGGWQTRMGRALRNRTLGIVGLGRLGGAMVPVAKGFGMEVIAWSPNLTDDRAAEAGAVRVDKDEIFRRADVISVHMVLSDRTRGLIGAGELGQMRQDAVLVNTSRGPLVEEAALIAALEAGRIGGAGLDVFDREPLPAEHPLRALPNAVLTPHLGYTVEETFARFYADTVENIAAWMDGAPLRLLEG